MNCFAIALAASLTVNFNQETGSAFFVEFE